jgi:predicted DCC family thiol-disulfide oxidoreductase YuxK
LQYVKLFATDGYPTMKEKPILQDALHPFENRCISIDDYLQAFSEALPAVQPAAHCPVCGEDVFLARLHDRAHTPYFAHAAGERARCPLVNSVLPDTTFNTIYLVDAALEQVRRGAFVEHWRHHLHAIRQHAPNFSVVRFTQAIAYADVLHLWSCPTLDLRDMPYILLVLSAFIAETPGMAHPTWIRFWFDSSVGEIVDLRRPRRAAPRLFRLHYRASYASMFPDARHLLDWCEVPMTGAFLDEDSFHITTTDALTFEAFVEQPPVAQR